MYPGQAQLRAPAADRHTSVSQCRLCWPRCVAAMAQQLQLVCCTQMHTSKGRWQLQRAHQQQALLEGELTQQQARPRQGWLPPGLPALVER